MRLLRVGSYPARLALTTALLAFAPRAAAQSAQPPEDPARREALALYLEAETAYREGRVDEAIALLERARAIYPTESVLVFNLARAYETAGRTAESLAAYEAYLAETPDADDRGAIERRIRALREQLDAEARLERERLERERLERERAAAGASVSPWPWITAGVGAIAIGVGVGLGVAGLDAWQSAVDDPIHASSRASYLRAGQLADAANGLYVAGSLTILTGVVWGVIDIVIGQATGAQDQ